MTIKKAGILALQGDFIEHQHVLESLGVETIQVRTVRQLASIDALIIPGGESTVIGKLAQDYGLIEPLSDFAAHHPVWGTCAGAILLAKDVHRDQPLLKLMDIIIRRNAFGRQIDSFEVDLRVPCLQEDGEDVTPFHAVFIRAPMIEAVHADVEVLATLENGAIVAARQRHLLVTSFHPELTDDHRFHKYFLSMVM